MNIVEKSFKGIYPEKEFNLDSDIKYSGRFNGFNANVKYNSQRIVFNLSRNWRGVSEEIKIGLLQELMIKVFKHKVSTINIDLYNNFLRSLHNSVPKTENQPILEESFNRVNELFFYNNLEKPNLKLGDGVNKLGHYEYSTDTISISKNLLEHSELLDYVMYHEMLHKKFKFQSKNGRHTHHSREFRIEEAKYPNAKELERRLSLLVTKQSVKRRLLRWF